MAPTGSVSNVDIYAARWVVPVDDPPIRDGAIAVRDGRIVDVGPATSLGHAGSRHEMGDGILLPGLVNPHTHLELTCYRDRLPRGPFWDWLERLATMRRAPDAADLERRAVADGAAQSLAAGVTCVGDISRRGVQVELLRKSPIRKVCFVELISGAADPPFDAASLLATVQGLEHLAEADKLLLGITPHAPYTVSPADLAAAVRMSSDRGLPLTMHLCETAEEIEWLAAGTGPVEALLKKYNLPTAAAPPWGHAATMLTETGLLSASPLLAHVNHADDALLDRLAESTASVVWCPRSHEFFGHVGHRWLDMIARGINVCVGTDSLASNATLSILDELRFVHRHWPDCPPETVLAMGTQRGADGLGLGASVGSLRPGKFADFIRLPWDPDAPDDPVQNVLAGRTMPDAVWIEGTRVA